MENMDKYKDMAIELSMSYGPKFILAILTLIIGFWVIKGITKAFRKTMEKRNVDASLRPFLLSLVSVLLKVLLIISVMSMVGIAMTSFIAILGAAGLAVGLALQGSLSNFAGGVLVLIFKPYKVGDVIEAQGFLGIVHEIQIFNTIIKTFDNRTVIIPNGAMANAPIMNASLEEKRRCDMEFGVSYTDDIDKVKALILQLIKSDSRILSEPAEPFVALTSLGDSSVNFTVRVWTTAADLWPVKFDFTENIKKLFDKEGVSIPFPQTDVHLFKEN